MNCLKADGVALAAGIAEKYAAVEKPNCDVLVCPPAIWIVPVVEAVKGRVAVGAEDAHACESGAHTGDISVPMIKDAGATFAIVGHLTAVICIGETEAERDAGKTIDVCRAQIQGSVPENATAENVVVAYEPVWAIGTGRTPTTRDVADVHAAIRAEIKAKLGKDVANGMRLLYGGSVKPSNAKELMALEDVDGALVGGASLKVADFWSIIETCL